ncbi:MAG: hypothetical protein GEU80_04355 [Dehalococcoidia bacterium]|nr:hypothetical protein [Dehalococcoidia bacterium]
MPEPRVLLGDPLWGRGRVVQRHDDLQLEEYPDFQRREWLVQRVGWAVMLLIVLGAALGLFGVGPLSEAGAGTDGRLAVDYERFVRFQSETELHVRLSGDALSEGRATLWLTAGYLDGMRVSQVIPEPESVEVSGDRLTYTFAAAPEATEVGVRFVLLPTRIGGRTGEIGTGHGPGFSLNQFVYP